MAQTDSPAREAGPGGDGSGAPQGGDTPVERGSKGLNLAAKPFVPSGAAGVAPGKRSPSKEGPKDDQRAMFGTNVPTGYAGPANSAPHIPKPPPGPPPPDPDEMAWGGGGGGGAQGPGAGMMGPAGAAASQLQQEIKALLQENDKLRYELSQNPPPLRKEMLLTVYREAVQCMQLQETRHSARMQELRGALDNLTVEREFHRQQFKEQETMVRGKLTEVQAALGQLKQAWDAWNAEQGSWGTGGQWGGAASAGYSGVGGGWGGQGDWSEEQRRAAAGAAPGELPKSCLNCGRTDKLMLCSGCRKVAFCGTDCQHIAWPQHSTQCAAMRDA
eukprot:TRINITY_DN2451_c2_g1_i1.p1 TRINITY_DN2451_c2_g1~~TRINITY_DN2451_c2_g1_i1.p1  ORF type:complete len:330 (+),score=109.74 TRINITY_DN2451_c2_g1_i1:120-1109(+)